LEQEINNIPKHKRPRIIGVTETKENHDIPNAFKMKGYQYVGKPIEKNPQAPGPHGGAGAWICNTLYDRTTKTILKNQHKDILWITIEGGGEPLHCAIVYSKPNEISNHKQIMETLTKNYEELQHTGQIIIMGDMNAHITHKTQKQSNNGQTQYDRALSQLLEATTMQPMKETNESRINENKHWTYHGFNGTKSVNDYVLTQSDQTNKQNYYRAHHDVSMGSTHRLITAKIHFEYSKTTWNWKSQTKPQYDWSEANTKQYQDHINKLLQNDSQASSQQPQNEKQTLTTLTKLITETMQTALANTFKTTTTDKNKQKSNKKNKSAQATINTAIQHKKHLLNRLTSTKKRHKSLLWKEIHKIQRTIQMEVNKEYTEENKDWWEAISKLNPGDDIKKYWREARKLNPKESTDHPTIMKDNSKRYTTKTSILQHIQHYYISLAKDEDQIAQECMQSEGMTAENTKQCEEKAKWTLRQNRTKQNKYKNPETKALCTDSPDEEEIEEGTAALKNNKTPGDDNIPAEAIKYAPVKLRRLIYKAIKIMWKLHITPRIWNGAANTLKYKQGDRQRVQNYRPITLLSSLLKLWEKILETRLRKIAEHHLPHLQMGSRANNSAEAAAILQSILLNKVDLENKYIYITNLDMNKAYNRVKRTQLWNKLFNIGVQGPLLENIISLYTTAWEIIQIKGDKSTLFALPNGLRQGSVISPLLYIIDYANVLTALQNTNTGIPIDSQTEEKVPAIMFVDDLTMFALTPQNMIEQIAIARAAIRYNGGIINDKKSSITSNQLKETIEKIIKQAGLTMKVTTSYISLGVKYNLQHKHHQMRQTEPVKYRPQKARAVLKTMINKGLRNNNMCPKKTMEIIKTTLLTAVEYGLDYASLTHADKLALGALAADAARAAYNIDMKKEWPDEWILLETNTTHPADGVAIKAMRLLTKAGKGDINPIVSRALGASKKFMASMENIYEKWNLQMNILKATPYIQLTKLLKRHNKNYMTMNYKPKHQVVNITSMGVGRPQTAYEKLKTDRTQAQALLTTRKILHLGHKAQNRPCPYCPSSQHHTIKHVINECQYPLTKTERDNQYAQTQNEPRHTLQNIVDILSGNTYNSQQQAPQLLAIIKTSPLLFPSSNTEDNTGYMY